MADLLLVDDEPDLALIVTMLGKRAGHRVVCCADVPSAWERLCQGPPDLVLLDVNLPGESGLELCRRARQAGPGNARLAEVRIALFVQLALTGDVAAGLEAGADFLISKDLVGRPEEWQRRVSEVLAHSLARPRGQSLGGPLGYLPRWVVGQPPPDWTARLNRALAGPAVRQLGPNVLSIVVGRALLQAGCTARETAWLAPEGGRLDLEGLPSPRSEQVVSLLAAVAEQMDRLLGPEVGATFRDLLPFHDKGLLP
jgi:CheY-like chemotaxis protein